MAFGKFRYYRSATSQPLDAAFAYPAVIAPAHKAIVLTQLAVYNLTNTAGSEIMFAIIPSSSPNAPFNSFDMSAIPFNTLGLANAALTNSSQLMPLVIVGIPTKGPGGTGGTIVIPPGGILVGFPTATANLNGTIEFTAIGYECSIKDDY